MKIYFTLFVFLFSSITLFSQDEVQSDHSTPTINSSLTVDNIYNIRGGIVQDYTTLSLFDFSVEYLPFKTGMFKHTSFYAHLQTTGGKGASENYIGDAQVVSNIEGDASRFIYELLVNQQLGDFKLSLGLHDLNTEFVVSDLAGNYINSSFGIMPTITMNVPVSIFPATSIGGIVSYSKKSFGVAAGVYNMNDDYVEEEAFNIDNHLFQKGYLGIGEVRYRFITNDQLTGVYKVGAYFKNSDLSSYESEEEDFYAEKNHGFYFVGDQKLWSSAKGVELGLFMQAGFAPKEKNNASNYYGIGLSAETSHSKYLPDFIGLAIASVSLNNYDADQVVYNTQRETTIGLSVKKELFRRVVLQPDFQYIINPSGVYDNAFVGMLRLQIELNN